MDSNTPNDPQAVQSAFTGPEHVGHRKAWLVVDGTPYRVAGASAPG